MVFLEDYDMWMARRLVQGVDVWLNNPRRPHEASGTSGMKVLVNGGLNLSELDGWWAEAYTSEVGWALGDGQEHEMRCGTVGTSWHATAKSSIHMWLCFINRALMHRRYYGLPRETCGVSWHRTEGGAIPLDRPAEVSRRHSRRARAR